MIGYIDKLADYLSGTKPKKAQSIPASLFYKNDLGIQEIPFDLFISEKHALRFSIGEHPLQNGCVIADHVKQELQELTIEGLFTNHSIKKLEETNEVKFSSEFGTTNITPSLSNKALEKFNKLKLLAKKKEPIRVVCSLETYPKMVITSIEYDRAADSGSAIRFSMTLKEVILVELKKTTSSYRYTPDQIRSANDKLIASKAKGGYKQAYEKTAAEIQMGLGVEVVQ